MKKLVILMLGCSCFLWVGSAASGKETRMIRGSDQETTKTKEEWQKHAGKDVWVISQTTDNQQPYTVCTNKDGFKFISREMGVIATAPDWQVIVFNSKGEVFCKLPAADFTGLECVERFDVDKLEEAKPSPKEQSQKLAGQNVTVYTGKPKYTPEKIKQAGIDPSEISVLTDNELPLQPQAKTLLERIYGIKGLANVPFKITLKDEKGRTVDCLSTDWCLKREADQNFFSIPKRYKEVAKESEVEHPKLQPLKPGQFRRNKPPQPQRHDKSKKDAAKSPQ